MSHPSSNPLSELPLRRRLLPSKVKSAREGAFLGSLLHSGWALGVLCLALDLAVWLGTYSFLTHLHRWDGRYDSEMQVSVCLVQFAVTVLCLFIVGGYDRHTNFISLNYMSEHCITLLASGCVGALLIYAVSTYGQMIHPSRGVLLASQMVFAPLSLLCRRWLRLAILPYIQRRYFLVLGAGEMARHLYRSNLLETNCQFLRFIDPSLSGQTSASRSIDAEHPEAPSVETPTFEQFAALLAGSCGVIIATSSGQMAGGLLELLTRLHYGKIPVYTLETFYGQYWRRIPVHAIDAAWPLQLDAQLAHSSAYAHAKRLIDIAAGGAALLVLGPLLGLVALWVWLESGSPVLFRQARIGRDRVPFQIYKFRTMYPRPVDAASDLYTRVKDPRITPLGNWLRKLRIDEFPQLWNVLKGDMSLIGPRAEWDRLVLQYEENIPFYHFRHLVKPGITGWAQVNYPYGACQEDAVQKLKYDLYYIRHYSLRLDAMIVLKTLHTMFWGKGQ